MNFVSEKINRTDFINSNFEKFDLVKKIGCGVDGDVYLNKYNKAVKFSFLYDYDLDIEEKYQNIKNVASFIQKEKPKHFVPIHSFSLIKESFRDFYISESKSIVQKFKVFSYEMTLCEKLNDDECKVFHSILKTKNSFVENYISIVYELSKYLDVNATKIINFVDGVNAYKIKHNDILNQNIMKLNNDFVLIDIDRVQKL